MNFKAVSDCDDRRFEKDRRMFSYADYSPERRSGKDRRICKVRYKKLK